MKGGIDKAEAAAAKAKGNDAFGKKQYPEAIGFYTAAHMADPTEPTYPLNRAMAYIKLAKYMDADRDCTTALKLSPNNVKALYRRATARVGAGKLEEAKRDYEEVLRLDPGNKEAKAGLEKVVVEIKASIGEKRAPIDLTASSSSAKEEVIKPNGVYAGRTTQSSTSSSVEAARKFLQQVSMSDDAEASQTAAISKPPSTVLPSKFPGEAGGFLREVITRKTSPAQAGPSTISTSSTSPSPPQPTTTEARPPLANSSSVSGARKTASALNFGASTSHTPPTAATAQPMRKPLSQPGKMSAIEFNRRWKSKAERLELLHTIDPESIPGMIDAMLEPELVAEILQTLAEGHRSQQRDEALKGLTEGIMTALPRCKRFGMTVCMLDGTEKGYASYLIDTIERSELKKVWEVA